MPSRSPWMKRRILGFQRRVWWPKCTPASSSSLMPTEATVLLPCRLCAAAGREASRSRRRRWCAAPGRAASRARTGLCSGRRNSVRDFLRKFPVREAFLELRAGSPFPYLRGTGALRAGPPFPYLRWTGPLLSVRARGGGGWTAPSLCALESGHEVVGQGRADVQADAGDGVVERQAF